MFTSGIMPICNFGVYDTKIRQLVSVFWSGTQISVLDFVVLKFDVLKSVFRCFEFSTFMYPKEQAYIAFRNYAGVFGSSIWL